MNQKLTLTIAAVMGALAVALGAFGTHALKNMLLQNGRTETYELAVRYHFYHALALLITGLLMDKYMSSPFQWASLFFLLGILLFSGSLYLYALTNKTPFAMITPLGGVCFIIAWVSLVIGFLKSPGQ
jgi:uncharacterized membrane protein YgdD (TMEM256/DUF423 family)